MIQTGCDAERAANRIDMPALAEGSSVLNPALYERRASSTGIVAELYRNSGSKRDFARHLFESKCSSLCQNCVKTLFDLAVGVSLERKADSPKLT